MDRNATIKAIRKALKARSGKAWSVTGGSGTAWGWLRIDAPPARRTWQNRCTGQTDLRGFPVVEEYEDASQSFGHAGPADRAELAELLGLDSIHQQGVSIPSQNDYYREYIARAEGHVPTLCGTPDWD